MAQINFIFKFQNIGHLWQRATCKNRLPKKMRKNKNCKKLKLNCEKLKDKCDETLGTALGNSKKAKKCRKALKNKAKRKVNDFCELTCKRCGKFKLFLVMLYIVVIYCNSTYDIHEIFISSRLHGR